MPPKRGRPVATDTTDPATLHRRELATARVRRHRERQQQRQRQDQLAVAAPMSVAQGVQADDITSRPSGEEQEAKVTVAGLGFRVQGLDLAEDIHDGRLQRDAVPVNEHNVLYHGGEEGDIAPAEEEEEALLHVLLERVRLEVDEDKDKDRDEDEDQDEDQDKDEEDKAAQRSGEETSVHSFASEHEEPKVSPLEEVSPLEYMVEKLYQQFQDGFHGCSPDKHDTQLRQHQATTPGRHYTLNDLFNIRTFPTVLKGVQGFATPEYLAYQHTPTAAEWKAMFCGIFRVHQGSQHKAQPLRLCLHAEQTQAVEPQVSFDVDSFLGFASSLAMARQGLWYQPVPIMRQNISTDIHIKSSIAGRSNNQEQPEHNDYDEAEQPERLTSAMLKDIPHFFLGSVIGAPDISVYILFPYLAIGRTDSGKFTSLTNEQHSRWLDQIFLPALHQFYDAHYMQHLPGSWKHRLANSMAHKVEGRQIETASYKAQSLISYHLQPEFLDDVWAAVLNTIITKPGLGDFRQPQLFFSAKNTKLQFKTSPSRPTLLDAMENFTSYLDRCVDLDFIHKDRLYVDLGKEICPHISLLQRQQQHTGDEPQVYCWKRCCLQSNLSWMYDGDPPSAKGAGQRFYSMNMLYDAAGLTSLAPRRSKQYRGGLVYSQYYCSVKELSDTQQRYPFDHDGLEELALDPQIRQGAQNAGGGQRSNIKVLEAAYCASKTRAKAAISSSWKKSFGIREEHRISWPLFQGLLDRLQQEADNGNELIILLDDCPSYAWAIKTRVFCSFLWRSVDKFATGFELVRAMCNQELVTWEQTKMMAMFLRCLRFTLSGHQLQREAALWWSRREFELPASDVDEEEGRRVVPRRVWYGLGFCNTLPRYGYCWIEPRVDWGRMVFKSDVTDNILFGNGILRRQYLKQGGSERDFLATTRRLEIALDWLAEYHRNEVIWKRIIKWITHICLQQFRINVLTTVASEIQPEYREEALKGIQPFCFEYLDRIMTSGVHLVSGNRCMYKDVNELVAFLFGYDDGLVRNHWEDRPFRKLYQRAITAIGLMPGGLKLQQVFERQIETCIKQRHWVLPYPHSEGLMQTTKQSQRMWYSTWWQGKVWRWAGKQIQEGEPLALPEYVSWTKEDWEEWIARQVRQAVYKQEVNRVVEREVIIIDDD